MPSPEGVSIDLRQYNDRVAKGGVSVQRLGPKSFQMIVKNFDPANGQELEPSIVPINIDGLDISIEQTQAQIADLEKAKASLTQLKVDMQAMETSGQTVTSPTAPAAPIVSTT